MKPFLITETMCPNKDLLIVACLFGFGWAAAEFTIYFDGLENNDLNCLDPPLCSPLMEAAVDKQCKCRNICFVQPVCMAFAVRASSTVPNEWHCKLFKFPESYSRNYSHYTYQLIPAPDTYLMRRQVQLPHVELREDGFYYTILKDIEVPGIFTSANDALIPLRNQCAQITYVLPRLELAEIKSNLSLEIALEYSTYDETPLVVDFQRFVDSIKIGKKPHSEMSETEICNCRPFCDFFETCETPEMEMFGLVNREVVSVGGGGWMNTSYHNDTKMRILCQGNHFGLRI